MNLLIVLTTSQHYDQFTQQLHDVVLLSLGITTCYKSCQSVNFFNAL